VAQRHLCCIAGPASPEADKVTFVSQNFRKGMQVNGLAMQSDLQGLFCVPEKLQYSKKHIRQTQPR
jgi:hypothetical protein